MDVQLNILMLGGRECGKSTLLSSMYYGLRECAPQDISLKIDDAVESAEMLLRKEQLLNIFALRDGDTWHEPSHVGTQGKYKSVLEITLCNHLHFIMNVMEVPGSEFQDKITDSTVEIIRQTQAFIIVIDTPWLMEKGRKGIRHNDVQIISELLISVFSENKEAEEKLLLFVPMKCEKYYNAGRINEVNTAIKDAYAELIEHLKTFEKTTIYITPALTLGNLEFLSFQTDTDGAERATYKYTGKENYAPRFTEQPFIYVMDYLLKVLNNNKQIEQPTVMQRIGNGFQAAYNAIRKVVFS